MRVSDLAHLLLFSILVCEGLSSPNELSKIGLKSTESGRRVFYEVDTGREIIFHGINSIVKGYPWIPTTDTFDIDTSLSEKDHATLSDLGVNVYRLGAMWPGVEPNKGEYNRSYVDQMQKIVTSAAKFGIYTLLDMHQDVLSEKFCGQGVPGWAALDMVRFEKLKFPFPQEKEPYTDVASDGFSTRADCSKHGWASYYNTVAAATAFGNLYTNESGLLTSWGGFWSYVASSMGSMPSVLGYELINEPFAGNVFKNPTLYIPGFADRLMLQPAYDSLVKDIREKDDKTLVFFAGVTWDDFVPAGFTAPPGGDGEASRSVFAFHYYEPPQKKMGLYFNTRTRDAERLKVGAMLTEFERPQPTNDDPTDPFPNTADMADKHLLSWSCWEYKTFCVETPETLAGTSQAAAFGACKTGYGERLIFDDQGNQNMVASRKIARTYAQKISGHAVYMSFNSTTAEFNFRFMVDTTITLPTEVFAHQLLYYPSGMKIMVLPLGAMDWKMLGTNIIGFFPTSSVNNGQEVSISITAI